MFSLVQLQIVCQNNSHEISKEKAIPKVHRWREFFDIVIVRDHIQAIIAYKDVMILE
jgi:hypothetical protein